jgi:hypothetical protein
MSNVTIFTEAFQPSEHELRARRNVFRQLIRFIALNLRMLRMKKIFRKKEHKFAKKSILYCKSTFH